MSNLLQRLDAAYEQNPSPDAVAHHISGGGWIRCSTITEEFFEENKRVPYVIGLFNNNSAWCIVSGDNFEWTFLHCATGHRTFLSSLTTEFGNYYYMIEKRKYVKGSQPIPLAE